MKSNKGTFTLLFTAVLIATQFLTTVNSQYLSLFKKKFEFLPKLFDYDNLSGCQVSYGGWLLAVYCAHSENQLYVRDLVNLHSQPSFELFKEIKYSVRDMVP